MKLTQEQRIAKAITDITSREKYVHLAGLLLMSEHKVIDSKIIPTACTDGRDCFYNRKFLEALNLQEVRGLILHEIRHVMYRHLHTWRHLYQENKRLANMAMDFCINGEIYEENRNDQFALLPFKEKACFKEEFIGMSTPEIYKILKKDCKGDGGSKTKGGGKGDGKSDGKSGGKGDGDGDGKSGGKADGKSGSNLLDGQASVNGDIHDWEGAKEMTEAEVQKLQRQIDNALRQGALIAGSQSANIPGSVDKIIRPPVDWRRCLREFLVSTCKGNDYASYQRPNRRYLGVGMYMPTGISEALDELVVAVDLSGSCWGVLPHWLGSIHQICETIRPDIVHVLYWDTEVSKAETYTNFTQGNEFLAVTKPVGGGGTDIQCVPKYIKKKRIRPQAVVVLTDGHLGGGWGSWDCPVFTCIVDNASCRPPLGSYVHIKSDA